MLQQPYYIEERKNAKNHLSLNGKWDFCSLDNPTDDICSLNFKHSATIPAGTYWNVYEAGILPHPYEKENCRLYKDIDQKVWYYRKDFTVADKLKNGNAFLCFEGVGYFTRVWLNGQEVGEHEGLFGGPIVDIESLLNFDSINTLIVEVKSCNYGIPDEEWKKFFRSGKNKYLVPWNLVKDFSTSNGLMSVMGIYRDVRIEFVEKMHLSRPYLFTEKIENNSAKMHLSVEIATGEIDELKVPNSDVKWDGYVYGYVNGINAIRDGREVEIKVQFADKKTGDIVLDKTFKKELYDYSKVGINSKYHECQFLEQDLVLDEPKLWYPIGLGEPNLYTVTLKLFYNGKETDMQSFNFGIRKYEMDYTAGEKMRSRWGKFQSIINGQRFFLKGMNWTPLDAFLTSSEQDYRWALELIKEQGVQMIRVWGAGNAPEQNCFYKLCDEMGILVWQDSFISNHDSPLWDKELFKFQQCMYLYRIRNHPSLVIHCSGNENNPYAVENNVVWVWQRETEDIDPEKIQIRTTPDKGIAHIYRGFEPSWFRKMYTELPLIGEAGTFTFPNAKTMRKMMSKEQYEMVIDSFGSENMIRDFTELGVRITEFDSWGMLKKIPAMSHMVSMDNVTIEKLCDTVGISSYEYYQFMIQAMREQYPVSAGVLPWVFKRPWPTVAVQMVDGLGDPVVPYYAVKNSYKPVEIHLAIKELLYAVGDSVELDVRVINEGSKLKNVRAVLSVYDPKFNKVFTKETDLELDAKKYQTKLPLENFVIPSEFNESYFFIHTALYCEDKKISQSFYWPCVLEQMKNEEFRAERRADSTTVLTHKNGPFLSSQIAEISTDRQIDVEITEIVREGDRIKGKLKLHNPLSVPVYPVKVTVLNDEFVQCIEDDSFFMDSEETREIYFIIRNDNQLDTKVKFSVKAWNAQENIITE